MVVSCLGLFGKNLFRPVFLASGSCLLLQISSHHFPSVHLSVSKFLLFIRHQSYWIRGYTDELIFHLIASMKTLCPSKYTSKVLRIRTSTCPFCGWPNSAHMVFLTSAHIPCWSSVQVHTKLQGKQRNVSVWAAICAAKMEEKEIHCKAVSANQPLSTRSPFLQGSDQVCFGHHSFLA